MDLLQLKYVVAIAESDSVTQAAERLHVSQSALSLSYKRLQEELGVQLFRRQEAQNHLLVLLLRLLLALLQK